MEALIIPTFLAGVLTILAPCTLPLIPAYLGFISGSSLEDLRDPQKRHDIRGKIFLNGVLFVLGFSIIFVLFGTLIGLVGQNLAPFRLWLARIGGVLVVLFGLFMLGFLKLPFLNNVQRVPMPPILKRGEPLSSLLLGSSFAVGWTPCVGPILGSILVLASTSTTAVQGGILLSVFSLGLAIPFLLITAGFGSITEKVRAFSRHIEVIGGVFLIFLGVLLFTNNMGLLIAWGFQLLRFINYEAILDYL